MHEASSHTEEAGSKSWSEATRWGLILALGREDTAHAACAREEFCRTYWHAVYGFARRRGYSEAEAQDLTQDFFVTHLLVRNAFQAADPARGKFRHFLLTALRNFLNNQYAHDHARKRCPNQPLVPLDDAENHYQTVSPGAQTDEMVFDRQWALAIVERAMNRLRAQSAARDRGRLFDALQEFLSRDPDDGEYDTLAAQFHMQNKAVAMAVSRLRQAYGRLLREELRQTVADDREAREELHYLIEVLGR